MKAFILPKAGRVENLLIPEIERPSPARGEVLVKGRANSVNPADVKIRGSEAMLTAFLGEVVETGDQATGVFCVNLELRVAQTTLPDNPLRRGELEDGGAEVAF